MEYNDLKVGHVEKTHHLYARYHMNDIESTDDCGTCDGACCEGCADRYVVEDFNSNKAIYVGFDREKAIQVAGYDFTR